MAPKFLFKDVVVKIFKTGGSAECREVAGRHSLNMVENEHIMQQPPEPEYLAASLNPHRPNFPFTNIRLGVFARSKARRSNV